MIDFRDHILTFFLFFVRTKKEGEYLLCKFESGNHTTIDIQRLSIDILTLLGEHNK